ncbi:MAG: YcfL family protein [Verrucomicrobiota bacterium]|jgi:uncharacterized protein YcfL
MSRWSRLALFYGWAALAAGCASADKTTAPPPPAIQSAAQPAVQPTAPATPGTDKRVIIDSALDRTLRVLKVSSAFGADGLLRIQLNVQNTTDAPKWFSYRIEWFDKDGGLLPLANGAPLPWMLMPHETSSIVATAPAATAKDFGIAFLPGVN